VINPFGKKLYHTIEFALEAIGENVPKINMSKFFALLRGIIIHALPAYLNPRRFYLKE